MYRYCNTEMYYSLAYNFMMKLSDNLRKILHAHHENANSLSLKIGVPQPTIHRILQGDSVEPRRTTLEKIAKYFGLTVEQLYEGPTDQKSQTGEATRNDWLMTVGDRINKARVLRSMSRHDLAKLSGVPYSTLAEIENNAQKSSTKIVDIALALNVSPSWLSSGKGEMSTSTENKDELIEVGGAKTDEDPPDDDDVLVEVVDIELSAGDGTDGVEFVETKSHHTYKRGFLRKMGITDPSKVKRCKVRGDSMQTLLYHGDIVSFNTGDTTIVDDGVYAILIADQLRVKRLRRRRDGGLIIISENKEQWPEEVIPPDELDSVKIIGRVFDKSGRGGLGF